MKFIVALSYLLSLLAHCSMPEAVGQWTQAIKPWKKGQCHQLQVKTISELAKCETTCDDFAGCNAINFSANLVRCILLGCVSPLPVPTGKNKNYKGYYRLANSIDMPDIADGNWTKAPNAWRTKKCTPLAKKKSTLEQCQLSCQQDKGCTAINHYDKRGLCMLLGCPSALPEPTWNNKHFAGYYMNSILVESGSGDCPWYKYPECYALIDATAATCAAGGEIGPPEWMACIELAIGIAGYCYPCICDIFNDICDNCISC